jgi:hypothetical protein
MRAAGGKPGRVTAASANATDRSPRFTLFWIGANVTLIEVPLNVNG